MKSTVKKNIGEHKNGKEKDGKFLQWKEENESDSVSIHLKK